MSIDMTGDGFLVHAQLQQAEEEREVALAQAEAAKRRANKAEANEAIERADRKVAESESAALRAEVERLQGADLRAAGWEATAKSDHEHAKRAESQCRAMRSENERLRAELVGFQREAINLQTLQNLRADQLTDKLAAAHKLLMEARADMYITKGEGDPLIDNIDDYLSKADVMSTAHDCDSPDCGTCVANPAGFGPGVPTRTAAEQRVLDAMAAIDADDLRTLGVYGDTAALPAFAAELARRAGK